MSYSQTFMCMHCGKVVTEVVHQRMGEQGYALCEECRTKKEFPTVEQRLDRLERAFETMQKELSCIVCTVTIENANN